MVAKLIIGCLVVAAGILVIIFNRPITTWREKTMEAMGSEMTGPASRVMRRIHFTIIQGVTVVLIGALFVGVTLFTSP